MVTQLEVGDRVRVHTLSSVPTGTPGRVAQTLISAPDLYYVQFDGDKHCWLMHASELELVTDAVADEDAN